MKLRIVCVGKLSAPYFKSGAAEYLTRVRRYLGCEIVELKEGGAGKGDPGRAVELEGKAILGKLPSPAWAVVLDERGRTFTSLELAAWLEKQMVAGRQELVFVIGGAYGLSREVRERADLLLSLSALTLPHQMVRLLLLEQLYRGFSILRNEPYHNA
ncbi:MAG: 23S rRNA (pseudouridine(1915)-N(3))-methyltransferase RlmH [Deltaproteobacteria bacterium]|nr:23S rRNA (pseudouridine(1915)-N(3))-methyltransferase RlmH [Deltaproteobacteria bacterium]